jgi:hypothetical protein
MSDSNYVNAPATKLLNVHCLCCGKPLVRVSSVNQMVGSDCAKNYGLAQAPEAADWGRVLAVTDGVVAVAEIASWGEDQERAANALIYKVAAEPESPHCDVWIAAIAAIGWPKVAAKLQERLDKRLEKAEKEAAKATKRLAKTARVEIVDGANGAVVVSVRRLSGEQFEAYRAATSNLGRYDSMTRTRTIPATQKRALWGALQQALPGVTLVSPKGVTVIATTPVAVAA